MKDSAKVKVAVSATIRNQLELDIQDYCLKGIGELCNNIIQLRHELAPMPETKRVSRENSELFKNSAPLQFTLHQRNMDFAQYADTKHIKIATLCRHYFEQYVDMPRGKREILLKKVELSKVDYAIKNRLNIWLDYRGHRQLVSPCFTAFSPAQVRAYLVICRQNHNEVIGTTNTADISKAMEFKAFRLCHIKNVEIATAKNCSSSQDTEAFHTRSNALYKKSEEFREHFDPFLCHGQELKVELSPEGVALYNRVVTNRPKVLKVPAAPGSRDTFANTPVAIENALESQRPGVYTLECSPELAKVYFPQFLDTAQILSPANLRNYFRQRFLKAATAYGLIDIKT